MIFVLFLSFPGFKVFDYKEFKLKPAKFNSQPDFFQLLTNYRLRLQFFTSVNVKSTQGHVYLLD